MPKAIAIGSDIGEYPLVEHPVVVYSLVYISGALPLAVVFIALACYENIAVDGKAVSIVKSRTCDVADMFKVLGRDKGFE